MLAQDAIDLYRGAVARRGGSFFWPTLRWSDGTRHFLDEATWGVWCPRCDSDVIILHGFGRHHGLPVRHVTCADCFKDFYTDQPGAMAFDFSTFVVRG